jgi:hypothetical protein
VYFSYAQGTNVLFIGDSFTQRNNLPRIFNDIAVSMGEVVSVSVVATDGWNLTHHWNDGKVLKKIQTELWDYVILQEDADATFSSPNDFTKVVENYSQFISKNLPNAVLSLLVMCADGDNATDVQAVLTTTTTQVANTTGSLVLPCGPAFFNTDVQAHSKEMGYSLWEGGGSRNPSVYGSYLCAAVVFTEIFEKSAVGGSASLLEKYDPNFASFLQKVAITEVAAFIPFAPSSLVGVFDVITSSMSLSWVDSSLPTNVAHTFLVEESHNQSEYSQQGVVGEPQFSYHISSAGLYAYRVRAANTHGASPYSNVFQIMVEFPVSQPTATSAPAATLQPTTTGDTPQSTTSDSPIVVSTTNRHESRYADFINGIHSHEEFIIVGIVSVVLLLTVGLFIGRTVYLRRKMKRSKIIFDFVDEEAPEY